MSNLRRLGNQIQITLPTDEQGFIGRECPDVRCEGYFKVQPGTGLQGNPDCHCPYCGGTAPQDHFYTKAQIEYAKSVALNQITGALIKDLKTLEFNHKPRGGFGIGVSMKVTGQSHPIRYYREQQLETEIVCSQCYLRYTIFGFFAYCPDCRNHNSFQILDKNLELVSKQIALAGSVDAELADHLVGDALENAVAAFDGFGREACRIRAHLVTTPAKAENLSFQSLHSARQNLQSLFGFDLSKAISSDDWSFTIGCFQKRHLLAHKMGVVDQAYLNATHDPRAILGRKIIIEAGEVMRLLDTLRVLGRDLINRLPSI
ncbi:hypothetical protein [Candidatus Viridilinea mediisalina]|uniref:Uncharacterized protein n=1 Tax=Candidatus Viridilinea mediisalina TaxID=2024553 RepID=A0A2A6RQA5_9CHLR|nr:hypothetical protein [Candidatus Viridilinea mediisalina]PDW05108.1 hypothetical protein CJ255_00505 [Candidatus Viridilinea mediisalina]